MNFTQVVTRQKALFKKHTPNFQSIYWTSTLLLSALVFLAAVFILVQPPSVAYLFKVMNFPVFLVYPLAFIQLLAVGIIITDFNERVSEICYLGLFFILLFAMASHIQTGVGHFLPAFLAFVMLIASFSACKTIKEEAS